MADGLTIRVIWSLKPSRPPVLDHRTPVMPSPFPGMNPFFEQAALWRDFHLEFIVLRRHQIVPRVSPGFLVQLKQYLDLQDLPPEPRSLPGRNDVSLAHSRSLAEPGGGLDVLEALAVVYPPHQDRERARFLEIRNVRGRDLVAVVEWPSPTNKREANGRERYRSKRRRTLGSWAHFVEIDLVRGGEPMPLENRPDCDDSVLVTRVENRPAARFWPIPPRDRLPVIPIALRDGFADARVDLQEALDRADDGPAYERFLSRENPQPPRSADDLQSAREFIPKSA